LTRVELFEAIRRDHLIYGHSVRWIARHHNVHRRTVRQALSSALPPTRKKPEREAPKLRRDLRGVIEEWLKADHEAPRKQRHTARRIHRRLVHEYGFEGAESSVRYFVGRLRRQLGLRSEAFVPLEHLPGQEAEVDWYEAWVQWPEGRGKVYVLQIRACYSGREFHVAFLAQTQQAFLEALVLGLEYFGGVFAQLRFDNLGSAVKKVLRGRQRQETERFVALRSHYLFEALFCLPGQQGAHEKGGVEGAVGRFRREHFVPLPQVRDLGELNEHLRRGCAADDERTVTGRRAAVWELWEQDRAALRPLPQRRFALAEVSVHRVDSFSRVQVRTNRYSVPVRLVGQRVEVQLGAGEVVVLHAGQSVARHERLAGRHGERLELDHYLELLWRKPGALERSGPLSQARAEGRWPAEYEQLWGELRRRHGQSEGTRQMVEVLMLHRLAEPYEVHAAVLEALGLGCSSGAAIGVLLRQLQRREPHHEPVEELGPLERYGRQSSAPLSAYDALLAAAEEVRV
jgi:Mu transposase, C-terminal domain